MEDFWLYNFNILFEEWNNIFPQKNMSRNKFLNSLTRFSLITLILFFIINSEFYWYIIPLSIIIGCIFFGIGNNIEDIKKENNIINKDKNCRLPTNNNPYMNVLRYNDNLNIPACEYSKDVDKKYKFNLYQNSNDLFDNKHLERQFYTMPITTIPNDVVTFGKWLYGTKGNCKYDGTRCLQYEDERYH